MVFKNIYLSIFLSGCAGSLLLRGLFLSCGEQGLFLIVLCRLLVERLLLLQSADSG